MNDAVLKLSSIRVCALVFASNPLKGNHAPAGILLRPSFNVQVGTYMNSVKALAGSRTLDTSMATRL